MAYIKNLNDYEQLFNKFIIALEENIQSVKKTAPATRMNTTEPLITVNTAICSDNFIEFRASITEDQEYIGRLLNPAPSKIYSYYHSLKDCGISDTIPKILINNLSVEEARDLAKRAQKLTLDTPEGAEYQINKLFSPEAVKYKFYGPPPGTVRVYSRDNISYFTGKSWKKISLPG